MFSFDGVGKEWTWEGLGVVKLQICDEIIDFDEGTDDFSHNF